MIAAFEKRFVAVNRMLAAAMITVMFVLMFSQVMARYLFAASFPWIDEVTGFLMVWLTYLGAGLAMREGRLVGFDIVQGMLSPRLRHLVRALLGLIMLVFMTFLIYCGIRFCAFGFNRETSVMQISRAIPYAGIPIGAAFFVAHIGIFLGRYVTESWDTVKIEDGGIEGIATRLMEE